MISKAETPKTREISKTAEKHKKRRKNKSVVKETVKQLKDNIIKFDEGAEVPTEQHVCIDHPYVKNENAVEP